jgi:hypothetical protein
MLKYGGHNPPPLAPSRLAVGYGRGLGHRGYIPLPLDFLVAQSDLPAWSTTAGISGRMLDHSGYFPPPLVFSGHTVGSACIHDSGYIPLLLAFSSHARPRRGYPTATGLNAGTPSLDLTRSSSFISILPNPNIFSSDVI